METKCPFCDWLAKIIDDEKWYRENHPRRNQEAYEHKYTVALVSENYYEGTYTGEASYHGYELNFCPVCGKVVEKEAKTMEIYTTYFANLRNLPNDITPIAICGKAPGGWKGLQYKTLAPKYSFFSVWKQTHDNDYYIKHYYDEVLNGLDATNVIDELMSLVPDDKPSKVVLVCYEKPNDFCHRHLVADWLQQNGFEVKEWEVAKK